MVKGALDSTVASSDFYNVFDNIVARNPQLNKSIEDVRNETNMFLVKVLRFYTHRDLAYVEELGAKKKYYCHLTHEMLSYEVSFNCMCDGSVKNGDKFGTYVKPYSNIYGIVANVRYKGNSDEKCLLACLNYGDDNELKSNVRNGEIRLVSGDSSVSITRERINLMTPNLFVNGLPYDEPKLENYFDKSQIGTIKSDIDAQLDELNEKVKDSGWQNVTFSSGYSNYSGYDVQVRKCGDVCMLRGSWKANATKSASVSSIKFAQLPNGFAPSREVKYRLQASGTAMYLLTIDTNGALRWSRYGTSSNVDMPSGSQNDICCTWLIN